MHTVDQPPPLLRRLLAARALPGALGVLLLALAGCAAGPAQHGGFLQDYGNLQRVTLQDGGVALGWVTPLQPGWEYRSALVEPVVFHPADGDALLMHPSDLSLLGDELNDRLLRAILPQVASRETPAADTLRFRMAVTGLRTPVDRLTYGALAADAAVFPAAPLPPDQYTALLLEMEVSDSISGAVLARTLRPGPVLPLAGEQRQVRLSQVNPLLDDWAAGWADSIVRLLRNRAADARALLTRHRQPGSDPPLS